MFAIGIRYLCGWAMATDPADRRRPEWPPHPDRIYMALAAAYFETEGEDAERDALDWLERQGAPAMWASDATERDAVTVYVPVNDVSLPMIRRGSVPSPQQVFQGLQVLPEHRPRQARQFPVAVPLEPVVFLVWPAEPPASVKNSLASVCSKVVRVGHSASLVQAWVEENPPVPNLVPTPGVGRYRLRIAGPGRLEHLAAQYANGFRPERSLWRAYDRPQPSEGLALPGSLFDDRLLMLRRADGRLLGLESTFLLTDVLRRAVIQQCPEPVPEWVSGHTPDGLPSQRPHLAFLPLADVGHEHADGHLLGVALAVPRSVPPAEVGRCLNPAVGFTEHGGPRQLRLYAGDRFEWTLELERRSLPPVALQSQTWTRAARRWATVTPVVLDRHPKGNELERQVASIVTEACPWIGLPRPADVLLGQVSPYRGVPPRREFPGLTRKADGGRLYQTHAILAFAEPVCGPVLLGAGRYRGYGLFRPIREGEETEGGYNDSRAL